MFSSCKQLKYLPSIDLGNVLDMSYMFENCTSLISISLTNTFNVNFNTSCFHNCISLTSIPLLDFSNIKKLSHFIFYGCEKLNKRDKLLILSKKTNDDIFKKCILSKDISENKIDKMLSEYN
jgi:hypothetical protein